MKYRVLILSPIFFMAIFFNIFAISYIHANTTKRHTITIILDELKYLADEALSEKEISLFIDNDNKDKRIAILKAFFRRYESPLYDHSRFIVQVSDENGIDYRLIPAIAMQESTACKFIPNNSFNCWGWGIYGNKITKFKSYQEGIQIVARGLKIGYIDKGLKTPEEIMPKYTPSSKGSWARGVSTVLGVLE
jgi:hypothetical protein